MIDQHFARPADAVDLGDADRVLIIALRHHGDVLLISPMIDALRAANPAVEVDVLVYSDTEPMIAHHPGVAQVHTIVRRHRASVTQRAAAEWQLVRALRAQRYAGVFHMTTHRRGAWITRVIRPRFAVAPRKRQPDWLWRSSFTHFFPTSASVEAGHPLTRRHTVQQNLDALRRIGVPITHLPPLTMEPGEEGRTAALALMEGLGITQGSFVLIQPTSRWFFKCWSPIQNASLISALLQRGETVVLSCAPDAREHAMIDTILEHLGTQSSQVRLATRDSTLGRLAALISAAELFIGIDSAPMHMAAAVGTPVVALFGPSGEDNWRPWHGDGSGRSLVLTSTRYPCRPCGQDGCGGGKVSACLLDIQVEAVLRAVDELRRSPTAALH